MKSIVVNLERVPRAGIHEDLSPRHGSAPPLSLLLPALCWTIERVVSGRLVVNVKHLVVAFRDVRSTGRSGHTDEVQQRITFGRALLQDQVDSTTDQIGAHGALAFCQRS
jgi:hypothetical protein